MLPCTVRRIYQTDWLAGVELDCHGKTLIAEIVPQAVEEMDIRPRGCCGVQGFGVPAIVLTLPPSQRSSREFLLSPTIPLQDSVCCLFFLPGGAAAIHAEHCFAPF
jgi:hypothetical protein